MKITINIAMTPRTRAAFRYWHDGDDAETVRAQIQANTTEAVGEMVTDYLKSARPATALKEERARLAARLAEIDEAWGFTEAK